MLIDEVVITVKAGNGGNGAVSLRRNGQTAKGGPDGGNGGNGGDVYIRGVNDISALRQFQFKKYLKADDGIPGKKNNLYGKNASDLYIDVPIGTDITDEKGIKTEINNSTPILIAKGGRGGLGNNSFKTATNQTPMYAEKGEAGEEKTLNLSLRIAADVGLIGLPNSGKSSMLKTLTNANPKIGDYPFTTLEPNLGSLDHLIIADIPGLIKDASHGKGLGFKFLKHIERTKFLIHCISSEESNPKEAFQIITSEMEQFNKSLNGKVKLIILTKKDLSSEKEISAKIKSLKSTGIKTIPFSILDDFDIQYLKQEIKTISKNE